MKNAICYFFSFLVEAIILWRGAEIQTIMIMTA